MNLKTHTTYPEININQHNVFTVKLIDNKGETKFEDMGVGKDSEDSRARAKVIVKREEHKYIKGEKQWL